MSCLNFDPVKYAKELAARGTPEEETKKYHDTVKYGIRNPALICPHCQTKGKVHAKLGAPTAVLTTSNTYKGKSSTGMHCGECGTDWTV